MSFYSFVVVAKYPIAIESPVVFLDTGVNVFSAEVPDLEAFKEYLANDGVVVREINRLDAHEAGTPNDLLLDSPDHA